MNTLTVANFRKDLSKVLDQAAAGEYVLIRRKKQMFTLVPVDEDELTITPELQSKINKARKEHKEGKTIACKTADDLTAFLDSL